MIKDEEVYINGDGDTSRDFCFIDNTVQVNILAATAPDEMRNQVYNVAVGDRTTLNTLHSIIKQALAEQGIFRSKEPIYRDYRLGDVRHSQADITKAQQNLGYEPEYRVEMGIRSAIPWYVESYYF